jgi:hypothetical protein
MLRVQTMDDLEKPASRREIASMRSMVDEALAAGAIDPDPRVCRFYGRCPQQRDRCRTEAPLLREVRSDVVAACHFA